MSKRLVNAYPKLTAIKYRIKEIKQEVKENAKEIKENLNDKAREVKNTYIRDYVSNNIKLELISRGYSRKLKR